MSIQGSINQLLGTIAGGAALANNELKGQRTAAVGHTDKAMERLESTGVKKIPGGPTLQQIKEPIESGREKLGNNLIDNLRAVSAERKATGRLNDLTAEAIGGQRWKSRAMYRQMQAMKHHEFMELVKNPNATQADFENWRNR